MGQYQDHIIAFARHYRQTTAIAIVPRFLTSLVQPGAFPLGEEVWADTCLEIPQGLRANWFDAIASQDIAQSDSIAIGQALQHFPVALLIGDNSDNSD